MQPIDFVIILALAAVVAALGMGFYSLFRGGEYAAKNSNRFMRYRVMAQAVAICVLLIALVIKSKS